MAVYRNSEWAGCQYFREGACGIAPGSGRRRIVRVPSWQNSALYLADVAIPCENSHGRACGDDAQTGLGPRVKGGGWLAPGQLLQPHQDVGCKNAVGFPSITHLRQETGF